MRHQTNCRRRTTNAAVTVTVYCLSTLLGILIPGKSHSRISVGQSRNEEVIPLNGGDNLLQELQDCWSRALSLLPSDGWRGRADDSFPAAEEVVVLGVATSVRAGEGQTTPTTCRPTIYPADFSSYSPGNHRNNVVSAMWKMTKDWSAKLEYCTQLKRAFCYLSPHP